MSHVKTTAILALAGSLIVACAPAEDRTPGLRFLPPAEGQSSSLFSTSKTVGEVAAAYRAAGFSDVRQSGQTVQVRTTSDALVDCGRLRQFALGNKSEFSASAEKAAVIGARNDGALMLRQVSVDSVATISLAGSGQAALDETHTVTVDYLLPTGEVYSRSRASFDETGMGTFADKTFCVSSGMAASVL